MRVVTGIAAVVIAAWLQISWFGHVRPFGAIPNLVLIVVILMALWGSATSALATAIGGGLLLDAASGSDFGLRMGFFAVTALTVVAARQFGINVSSAITGIVVVVL